MSQRFLLSKNILLPLLLVAGVAVTLFFLVENSQKTQTVDRSSASLASIYSDNLDRGDLFENVSWQLETGRKSDFQIQDFEGRKALVVNSQNGSTVSDLIRNDATQNSIIEISLYDTGDNDSVGLTAQVNNEAKNQITGFEITNTPNYSVFINQTNYSTYIPRSKGWHKLQFVVSQYGTYSRIDDYPTSYSDVSVNADNQRKDIPFPSLNYDLTKVYSMSLGRKSSGAARFAEFNAYRIFNVPTDKQAILDNWTDVVYKIYKDADVAKAFDYLKKYNLADRSDWQRYTNKSGGNPSDPKNGQICEDSGWVSRSSAGQALMYIYIYTRDNKVDDLNKAKDIIRRVSESYPYWGKCDKSYFTANVLAFDAWWIWNDLDQSTREKFNNVLIEESNYYSWWLDYAIKGSPDPTVDSGVKLLLLDAVTGLVSPNDYKDDTKAETNGGAAQLMANAVAMLPNHPDASKWEAAGRCWAFHTVSHGESKLINGVPDPLCPYISRTLGDDGLLGNHSIVPNALYAMAAVTPLQQGQFAYKAVDKAVPVEFTHNITDLLSAPVWSRNVTFCTDQNWNIKIPECKCGLNEKDSCSPRRSAEDWGDRNMELSTFMLFYDSILNNNPTSGKLLTDELNKLYTLTKDLPRNPSTKPITDVGGINITWQKSLEFHPQSSAKYYVLTHLNDPAFRAKYFPKVLGTATAAAPAQPASAPTANVPPTGKITQSTCDLIKGQISDANAPTGPKQVHFWIDGSHSCPYAQAGSDCNPGNKNPAELNLPGWGGIFLGNATSDDSGNFSFYPNRAGDNATLITGWKPEDLDKVYLARDIFWNQGPRNISLFAIDYSNDGTPVGEKGYNTYLGTVSLDCQPAKDPLAAPKVAVPVLTKPTGSITSSSCDAITGNAQDPNSPNTPRQVDFWMMSGMCPYSDTKANCNPGNKNPKSFNVPGWGGIYLGLANSNDKGDFTFYPTKTDVNGVFPLGWNINDGYGTTYKAKDYLWNSGPRNISAFVIDVDKDNNRLGEDSYNTNIGVVTLTCAGPIRKVPTDANNGLTVTPATLSIDTFDPFTQTGSTRR